MTLTIRLFLRLSVRLARGTTAALSLVQEDGPPDRASTEMKSPNVTVTVNATPTAEQLAEHMHLVHRIVAHFMRRLPRSVQREDLISAGTLGLFYALRSSAANAASCPEMFASYARIRIRGSIVDELRRHDWAPRRRKEKKTVANASVASIASNTSVNAASTAVAGPTTSSTDHAERSNVIPFRARSQNTEVAVADREGGEVEAEAEPMPIPVQVVGFDDLPPTVMLREEGASPLEECEERAEKALLHKALSMLPPREAQIIRMRYFEGIPSKAIAEELGLSEARISQLHARATLRLKTLLAETGDELDLAA
jgi:RNA polymerase sigma factor for flagellar operon FliA